MKTDKPILDYRIEPQKHWLRRPVIGGFTWIEFFILLIIIALLYSILLPSESKGTPHIGANLSNYAQWINNYSNNNPTSNLPKIAVYENAYPKNWLTGKIANATPADLANPQKISPALASKLFFSLYDNQPPGWLAPNRIILISNPNRGGTVLYADGKSYHLKTSDFQYILSELAAGFNPPRPRDVDNKPPAQ